MINPAQYNKVLQSASDEQLMAMLRRPDKIPSQFIVAEINRRQAMRQAQEVEKRRVAQMAQQMPQQAAMAQAQPMTPQQPTVGMFVGGNPGRAMELNSLRKNLPYRTADLDIIDASSLQKNLPYNPALNSSLSGVDGIKKLQVNASSGTPNSQPTRITPTRFSDAELIAMQDTNIVTDEDPLAESETSSITETINNAYKAFKPEIDSSSKDGKLGIKEVTTSNTDRKITPAKVESSGETDTSAIKSIVDKGATTSLGDNTQSQVSLFAEVFKENNRDRDLIRTKTEKLAESQRERLKGLQSEFDKVTDAMEELTKFYDKNATTGEYRFFRSLFDMGVDLLSSPEANFFQALGKSGKAGIKTWDALNKENKQNLFEKYKAGVSLAQTRANLTSTISAAADAIDRGEMDAASRIIESRIKDRQAVLGSSLADKEIGLKELGLGLQGRGQDLSATANMANIASSDNQRKSSENIANAQLNQSANIANQRDARAGIGQDITIRGQDIQADIAKDKNAIAIKGLELNALNSWASNMNSAERNRIADKVADKPAAAVQYLETITANKGKYGLDDEDIKDFVLGTSKGKASSDATLEATARALALKDIDMQSPIPGVEPLGPDGQYTSAQYLEYHRKNLDIFRRGNSSSSSNTRTYDPNKKTLN